MDGEGTDYSWGILENGQRRSEREAREKGKCCKRRRIGVAEQAKGNLPL